MSVDWEKAAKAFWDEQPHPRGHGLKIKEVATAVKLASMAKFGGHATLHEAALFWQDFAPGGQPVMAPEEFEQALERMAPVSYAFHGRPPTLREIVALKDKPPVEVNRHFGELPDKNHPEISAANMVKAYQSARPWARQHLEREPVKTEAAYLHHSGEAPERYYARLAAQNTQQPDEQSTTAAEPDDGTARQVSGSGGGGGVARGNR